MFVLLPTTYMLGSRTWSKCGTGPKRFFVKKFKMAETLMLRGTLKGNSFKFKLQGTATGSLRSQLLQRLQI
jgi:hypothetical protein